MNHPVNLLVTLNDAYIPCMNVMLTSLLHSNPKNTFRVFLLHSNISKEKLSQTEEILQGRGELIPITASAEELQGAPTSSRYPLEIYYRIFAVDYLPRSINRVLYLDPDVIVNGSLDKLYTMPMDGYFFAAASHVNAFLQKMNKVRLDMDENSPYINSGVMMMNLELLRKEQDRDAVFRYIEEHKNTLILPDQDVISSLYGHQIIPLNPYRYNMTERLWLLHSHDEAITLDWIRKNSTIIHYCGRNKPWKKHYIGQLDTFFWETVARMNDAAFNKEKN